MNTQHNLILFTSEAFFEKESIILNEMLGMDPDFRLHFRKPNTSLEDQIKLLSAIQPEFLHRITVHQHQEALSLQFAVNCHQKEHERLEQKLMNKLVSSSFHHVPTPIEIAPYAYFFCSPVFSSISKQNYSPTFSWDITNENETFKHKAVALGGISMETLQASQQKGFRAIALMGSVWQNEQPIAYLKQILDSWRNIV